MNRSTNKAIEKKQCQQTSYCWHTCYICYLYPHCTERQKIAQVILAFSVFMLAIAERMPETSESIPLIGENWISIWMLVFGINHNRFVNWELLALDAQNLALAPFSWFTVGELQYMAKYFSDHTSYLSFFLHWQNFWKIKFTPKNANFSR